VLTRFEVIAALLGQLDDRPIEQWITLEHWRGGLPPGVELEPLLPELLQRELIEHQRAYGCRRCASPETEHEEADHAFEAARASARIRPEGVIRAVITELAALEQDLSFSDPRPQLHTATWQATGLWSREKQFSVLFHFGRDTPGLPRTDAGLPVVQVNFRGAPGLPNPPAVTVEWTELLGEKDVRGRVHEHILRSSDPSFYSLADIAADLSSSATEPFDALGEFLTRCGFRDLRGDPDSGFEAKARLGSLVVTRRFDRDPDELIVECTCEDRPGWHLHGFRNRRPTRPALIEPRLEDFAARALRTSRSYRQLRARSARVPKSDADLPKDVGAFILSLSSAALVVLDQEWKHLVTSTLAAPLETAGFLGSLTAALYLIVPSARKAWLDWRAGFLVWPNRPR